MAANLVREAGLPFRLAHKVVATLVQTAVCDGIPSDQLTLAQLQAAAQAVLGRELAFSEDQFQPARVSLSLPNPVSLTQECRDHARQGAQFKLGA